MNIINRKGDKMYMERQNEIHKARILNSLYAKDNARLNIIEKENLRIKHNIDNVESDYASKSLTSIYVPLENYKRIINKNKCRFNSLEYHNIRKKI